MQRRDKCCKLGTMWTSRAGAQILCSNFAMYEARALWPVGVPNVTYDGIFVALKSCARTAANVAPVSLTADGIVPSSTMELSYSFVNGRFKRLL